MKKSRQALEAEIGEAESGWDKFKTLCRDNKLAVASAVVILLITFAAIFAPLVAPYDPAAQDLTNRLQGMSWAHPFGTDQLGRDVLSRMTYGARISLCIGIFPTLISMILGTVLGLISGYLGKTADFIIMRLADITMAFPSLLLAMVVMYTLGNGIINIFLALTIVSWAGTARVVRSQTLVPAGEGVCGGRPQHGRGQLQDHVPAHPAQLSALPDRAVHPEHPWLDPVGIQPELFGHRRPVPRHQLGPDGLRGQDYLVYQPVIAIAPGVAILVLALAFNFLGDGVRDVMDPYTKKQ